MKARCMEESIMAISERVHFYSRGRRTHRVLSADKGATGGG